MNFKLSDYIYTLTDVKSYIKSLTKVDVIKVFFLIFITFMSIKYLNMGKMDTISILVCLMLLFWLDSKIIFIVAGCCGGLIIFYLALFDLNFFPYGYTASNNLAVWMFSFLGTGIFRLVAEITFSERKRHSIRKR
jgi:hypothetical protein